MLFVTATPFCFCSVQVYLVSLPTGSSATAGYTTTDFNAAQASGYYQQFANQAATAGGGMRPGATAWPVTSSAAIPAATSPGSASKKGGKKAGGSEAMVSQAAAAGTLPAAATAAQPYAQVLVGTALFVFEG